MKKFSASKYLWLTFTLLGLCVIGYSSFLIVSDPFGIFRIFEKQGWNLQKPDYHLHTRQAKPLQSYLLQPRVAFFGSSRAEYLAPDIFLSRTDDRQMFNFGLSSCTPLENSLLVKYACKNFPLEEAYFSLDFYTYTSGIPFYYSGLDSLLLSGKRSVVSSVMPLVITADALQKALECIDLNERDSLGTTISYHYNRAGSRKGDPLKEKLKTKGRDWLNYEYEYSRYQFDTLYNSDVCRLEPQRLTRLADAIKTLKDKSECQLHAYTSPMHVINFNQLLLSRAWPHYLDFLAFTSRQTDFIFFGGNNMYTADSALFWDVHHARAEMFAHMSPYFSSPKTQPDSTLWGILVTQRNFDALRSEIEKYRQKIL
ncbi:MAG: hypothetical protein KDC37_05595 [Flavobacteriales bacterium]|nr:hypothetical protein [Flavobacteriales bacterium]